MRAPEKSRSIQREIPAIGQRQRIARIIPACVASKAATSADAAAHRAVDGKLAQEEFGVERGHAAKGRAEPDDIVEAGGIAQRAHHVVAVGDRQQPRRKPHRRAAGGAAGACPCHRDCA